MRSQTKRALAWVLAFVLLLAPFLAGIPASANAVEGTDSDLTGLTLELDFPPFESIEITRNGQTYQRLSMKGYGHTTEVGKPELPVFGRFIAVPKGASVQVEVLDAKHENLQGFHIYPAQEPIPAAMDGEPGFALDEAFYSADAFYPAELVEVESGAVIRGQDVVIVRVFPMQYNPGTSELRVCSFLRLRVNFVGGKGADRDPRLRSPYYDRLLQSLLVNRDVLGATALSSSDVRLSSANGCDFLIITHPDFLTAAETLATWRRQKGLDTEVRTTTQTGSTAEAIKSYIQNAYNTWDPAPSFVLLLGDAEFLPTNYVTPHFYENNRLIGTDLYYATVDGSDYFPDLSIGRIPVDTAAEASAVVDKIISYERHPTADTGFYNRIIMVGYFQDSDLDGYEDRSFILTSEQIRDYLVSQGYTVQRIYEAPTSSNPTNYNNGTYASGEPLPPDLLRSNGFQWNGNATDITNAINAGAILVNHEDHGAPDKWGYPRYTTSNIDNLNNGDNKLPVVFSMNCQSGWFDNETDNEPATPDSVVYFAEKFLRRSGAGAVGVVAATRTTFSGHNDSINKGMIDGIWSDFLSYSQSGPFASPQRYMGHVLDYGKMYYASVFSATTVRKIQFEAYHYFGDPAMQIWIAPPTQMSVSHAEQCEPGATSFDVDVNVNGAVVTVVKDGQILGKATASGGQATVPLSPAPTSGEIVVTVSEPNYVPYEDGVPVQGEPTAISLAGYTLSPGRGGVQIDWETASEINNVGFHILRSKSNDVATAVRVNPEIILSQATGRMVGAAYTYVDASATAWVTYHYWLEAVEREPSKRTSKHYLGAGSWNVPRALQVYPASGSALYGRPVQFTGKYRDLDADLEIVYLLVNDRLRWASGIVVRYDVKSNLMSLWDDQARRWLPGVQPGQRACLTNQYGGLFAAGSEVGRWRGDTVWTVTWELRFWRAFRGEHKVYILAVDADGNLSEWQQVGTWTVQ